MVCIFIFHCVTVQAENMLTFTEDFSRYTTAYFIKFESEVLSKFMEYVNSVEKHTGHQIMKLNILAEEDVKVLRSDNGG